MNILGFLFIAALASVSAAENQLLDIPVILQQNENGTISPRFTIANADQSNFNNEDNVQGTKRFGSFEFLDSSGNRRHYRYYAEQDGFLILGGIVETHVKPEGQEDESTPEPESPELIAARQRHLLILEEVRRERALNYEKVLAEKRALGDAVTELGPEANRDRRDVPVVSIETVPDRIVDASAVAVAKEEHLADHAARSLLIETTTSVPLSSVSDEGLPVVQIPDSPEVEEAKREHFSVHERFLKYLKSGEVVPIVIPDEIKDAVPTQVPDAPDVAAAKEEHLEAHRLAKAALITTAAPLV